MVPLLRDSKNILEADFQGYSLNSTKLKSVLKETAIESRFNVFTACDQTKVLYNTSDCECHVNLGGNTKPSIGVLF